MSFVHDPHSERGNSCPRNKFGITDHAELQPTETVFALKRARQLEAKGITGKFEIPHLQSIHKDLFQDVFPWAGEFRVVNISKGNSNFGPAMHIFGALDDALGKLKRESFLVNLIPKEFANRAAFYLGEINAIHPFREGNGAGPARVHPSACLAGGASPELGRIHATGHDRRLHRQPYARRQCPAC